MTQSMPPTPRVIANRKLRDQDTGALVQLVVHEPLMDRDAPDGDWSCRCEIQRNGGSTTITGKGVDSLQALFDALNNLRRAVQPEAANLAWLHAGELGLPLLIFEDDPDALALFEHLIEAEHCRQRLSAKRRQTQSMMARAR
jgi:hypothetical protein